ncbi:MAG: hypothetical protein ABI925_13040, partial [Verrucomicrobiota bacterium]
ILARAFDLAWERYYQTRGVGTVSEEIARHSLAKYLVAKAKEAVKDEEALAEGGLQHLISLSPAPSDASGSRSADLPYPSQAVAVQSLTLHFRITSAGAKFVRPWRVGQKSKSAPQN